MNILWTTKQINREQLKSKLLEEGVSSYRKRGRKRTTKKRVNLRKDIAKEVEELWSERVSHSEIKYINIALIWLWESLTPLWSNPRVTVLNDLRTTLQNCVVIGQTLLHGITVWTSMRLFTLEIGVAQFRSVTKIAPKSPSLSVNKSPILDLSSLIFVALQKLFSVVWTVNPALVKYHRIQILTKWVFNVHLGTLSEDNDDNSENVCEKINLRSFKLNRVYLDPLDMSNAGDFSWSWILKDFIQVQKEEGEFVVVCPRPP